MNKKVISLLLMFLIFSTLAGCVNNVSVSSKVNLFLKDIDDSLIMKLVVNKNELAIKPATPVKEGYEFIGWYIDKNYTETANWDIPITADTTYYAKWESLDIGSNKFIVEFETFGGTVIEDQIVLHSGCVRRPEDPIKEGYEFIGWYIDDSFDIAVNWNALIYQNVTYYAKYQKLVIPTGQVEIEFWHAMGQSNQKVIAEMISAFNEKYPNIIVSAYSKGGYDELREAIIYACAAGVGPTIAQTRPNDVAEYIEMNEVKNLDNFVNHAMSNDEINQIFPKFLEEGRNYQKEGIYSMPFNKSTEVLFYNKDFFCKYSTDLVKYGVKVVAVDTEGNATDVEWPNPSWEQVEAISQYFLTTPEYAAIEDKRKAASFTVDSAANLFITLNQQWGGKNGYIGYDENSNLTYLFHKNELGKKAIQWFVNGYDGGYFATPTKFGEDYSSITFVNDKTIMTLGSSAGAVYNIASDGHFRTGVTHYPQRESALVSGNEKYVIQQGGNLTLFKCDSFDEEMAGWLFIRHLMSYEMSLLWATETAYFPIRQDVYAGNEYQAYLNGYKLDKDGNFELDENGQPIVEHQPGVKELTQKIFFDQQEYMFSTAAYECSSFIYNEVESLVCSMLYAYRLSLEDAYNLTISRIKEELDKKEK